MQNRIIGALLAAVLAITVIYCEELMKIFGQNELKHYEGTPCSDILDVVSALPMYLMWFVVLVPPS